MVPRTELIQLVREVIRKTDEAFKRPEIDYSNAIDVTYYRGKKDAVKGRYDFRTGMITLYDGQAINWKH